MNRESLMLALSDIDDKYIAEADVVRSKCVAANTAVSRPAHKNKRTLAIGGLCAACAVFALVLGLVLPVVLPNRSGGSNAGSGIGGGTDAQFPQVVHGLHSVASNHFGSVTFSDMTDYSITFDLKITGTADWVSWDVVIFALTERNGQSTRCYFATNSDQTIPDYEKLECVTVTINGEPMQNSTMPTEIGEYTVVFDFSVLNETGVILHLVNFTVGDLRFTCC